VLAFIFFIAIANFALGFAVHELVERRYAFAWPEPLRFPRPAPPATADACDQHSQDTAAETSAVADSDEPEDEQLAEAIPAEWLDVLEAEAVVARSFVEAAAQTFRLQVGRYRRQLLNIDDRLRAAALERDRAGVLSALGQLERVNAAWYEKQMSAADLLSSREGSLGDFEAAGASLRNVLAQQASQIESTRGNLASLMMEDEVAAGCPGPIREVCRLLDLAHALRDGMHDALAAILRAENRVADLDKRQQFDAASGMIARLGLDSLLAGWRSDDPTGIRIVSMILIDLDHCAGLNEKWGVRLADKVLDAFACQLMGMVRKDRGFDRLTRLDGQSFLALLGDTGPREATSAAERIRQTVRVITFELPGGAPEETAEANLSATLAVVEIAKDDDSTSLLARLRAGVREAKREGRNRTFLDEGNGFAPVEPPVYQVKARIISLAEPPVGQALRA
jgi:diguanylate cyclase (GGDEF)-like protein